jgi:hypothetical protein
MGKPKSFGSCVDNLLVTCHERNKGELFSALEHVFDHVNFLAAGSLKYTVNGQETVVVAPSFIYIQKGVLHSGEALEDNTRLLCLHALRNKDTGDLLDETVIPKGITPLALCMKVVK